MTTILNRSHSFRSACFLSTALLLAVIGSETTVQAQYSYATLSVPGATNTFAEGISGNYIIGQYENSNGEFPFLYNISSNTYTTLSLPGTMEFPAITSPGMVSARPALKALFIASAPAPTSLCLK